jgi:hypothetical protein
MPLPPMNLAPAVAKRLAKFGVNCLRLHAIDHRWPNGILMRSRRPGAQSRWWGGQDEPTRALDPEALARLDYFIVCCKAQGIYLDLNLNVARTFSAADGVVEAEVVRWGKGLTYFDAQLIELQKEYAAQLVGHVNPFTGVRYGEESAIALIELVNENSLIEFWARGLLSSDQADPTASHWHHIPAPYAAELDRRWNAWLKQRYPNRQALASAWEGDLRDHEDPLSGSVRRLNRSEFEAASAVRFSDEARFYYEVERAYFLDMQAFLHGKCGARQPILGTSDYNHGWSALPMLQANATLDIMDGHFYWQHPRSHRPGVHWSRPDWTIPNSPMVDAPDASVVAHCARSAVEGKPYIVSECNEPFPNDYAAEFVPITAAYAALQDWDGILFYDYDGSWGSPYWQNLEWQDAPSIDVFSVGKDPVMRAARETVVRAIPQAWVLDSLRRASDPAHPFWIPDLPGRLALVHRTAIASFQAEALSPDGGAVSLPEGKIVSDTGELIWEESPGDGRVTIDTPCHQAIIGRAGQRTTGNMAVDLETPFAAVELASLDGRAIATSERMLLVAGARVANSGMRWTDATRQTTGEAWGGAPSRIEPVCGTLTLHHLQGARTACLQPLDERGQPWGEAQECAAADGGFRFHMSGPLATPWYLVEIRR